MKFGQGVYWGDGGWRAQIMGAVGGKRVTGLGGLGNGWAMEDCRQAAGRLRAGHARLLRGGERKIVGVRRGV